MPLGNRFQVFQSIGTVSELINSFINPCSCWQCTLISDQQCHTCVSSFAIKKESLQGRRMITKHCFMKTYDSSVSCNVCNIIISSGVETPATYATWDSLQGVSCIWCAPQVLPLQFPNRAAHQCRCVTKILFN